MPSALFENSILSLMRCSRIASAASPVLRAAFGCVAPRLAAHPIRARLELLDLARQLRPSSRRACASARRAAAALPVPDAFTPSAISRCAILQRARLPLELTHALAHAIGPRALAARSPRGRAARAPAAPCCGDPPAACASRRRPLELLRRVGQLGRLLLAREPLEPARLFLGLTRQLALRAPPPPPPPELALCCPSRSRICSARRCMRSFSCCCRARELLQPLERGVGLALRRSAAGPATRSAPPRTGCAACRSAARTGRRDPRRAAVRHRRHHRRRPAAGRSAPARRGTSPRRAAGAAAPAAPAASASRPWPFTSSSSAACSATTACSSSAWMCTNIVSARAAPRSCILRASPSTSSRSRPSAMCSVAMSSRALARRCSSRCRAAS